MNSADWPPTDDLVDAVREFLVTEVRSATTGRVNYMTRVAANVLGAVVRELRSDDLATAIADEYTRLGAADEESLVDQIRSGQLDDRLAETTHALRRVASLRVGVSNPAYLRDNTE